MTRKRTPAQHNHWVAAYARTARQTDRAPTSWGTIEVDGRELTDRETVIFAPGYDPIISPGMKKP